MVAMGPVLTVSIFILGAAAGGLGVLVHQTVMRARLKNEFENQLKKALFGPIQRNRVSP